MTRPRLAKLKGRKKKKSIEEEFQCNWPAQNLRRCSACGSWSHPDSAEDRRPHCWNRLWRMTRSRTIGAAFWLYHAKHTSQSVFYISTACRRRQAAVRGELRFGSGSSWSSMELKPGPSWGMYRKPAGGTVQRADGRTSCRKLKDRPGAKYMGSEATRL